MFFHVEAETDNEEDDDGLTPTQRFWEETDKTKESQHHNHDDDDVVGLHTIEKAAKRNTQRTLRSTIFHLQYSTCHAKHSFENA
jgi:hypothetical protein